MIVYVQSKKFLFLSAESKFEVIICLSTLENPNNPENIYIVYTQKPRFPMFTPIVVSYYYYIIFFGLFGISGLLGFFLPKPTYLAPPTQKPQFLMFTPTVLTYYYFIRFSWIITKTDSRFGFCKSKYIQLNHKKHILPTLHKG